MHQRRIQFCLWKYAWRKRDIYVNMLKGDCAFMKLLILQTVSEVIASARESHLDDAFITIQWPLLNQYVTKSLAEQTRYHFLITTHFILHFHIGWSYSVEAPFCIQLAQIFNLFSLYSTSSSEPYLWALEIWHSQEFMHCKIVTCCLIL